MPLSTHTLDLSPTTQITLILPQITATHSHRTTATLTSLSAHPHSFPSLTPLHLTTLTPTPARQTSTYRPSSPVPLLLAVKYRFANQCLASYLMRISAVRSHCSQTQKAELSDSSRTAKTSYVSHANNNTAPCEYKHTYTAMHTNSFGGAWTARPCDVNLYGPRERHCGRAACASANVIVRQLI